MSSLPQVNDAHTPSHPHAVLENMIHQTRPSSSTALWSTSDAVDSGQWTGPSDWSVVTASFIASIKVFSNLYFSSSFVGLDHMGQPSLPTCISKPLSPMTLSSVHCLSLLGPLLVCTNRYIPGTSHKTCHFGDALTQSSSHHNLSITLWRLTIFSC